MILGVNGIRLLGQRSGVARCIEALLRCFDEVDHPFSEVRVYTPVALPADVALPAVGRNVVVASALPSGLWEQIALPRAHGKRDLLLCPSYISPWAARCPTLLIHHGSYEGYPEAFAWWPRTRARLVYALSAHRATQVTTVSEHSRRDIARFYHLSPQKISVISDGVDTKLFFPSEDAGVAAWRRRVLGEDTPFLLYVGKPTRRRNLPELLEAFALMKRGENRGHKLVLAGVDLRASGLAQRAAALGVLQDEVERGADVLAPGTILARNSSTLKYVIYVKGGVSNENGIPKAVLLHEVVSTGAGDVTARPLISGVVVKERLIIDADGDDSNIDNAVRDELRDYGLVVENVSELNILDNQ